MKDTLIVWTWPAWLSAWIYAKRYELDILAVWDLFWWTISKTHLVENWPWIKSITWFELWMNLMEHAKKTGIEIKMWKVLKIEKIKNWFKSQLQNWEKIESKTIIFATWSHKKELWIDSEKKLKNKWVSYCATCDGAFFKNKIVWIVWWSDSAVKESLLLSKYASKVYIIYRKSFPRAEPINMKRMKENKKIEIIWNSNVIEILWENFVTWAKLDTWKTLNLQWLFIEIWSEPNYLAIKDLWINLNKKWEIIVDKFWNTNLPWFYAAWDITDNPFKQAIVASAQWASCANLAFEYIK